LNIVEGEPKNQCKNNIKIGATEIWQVAVDSIQLYEDSELAEFNAFGNETPEPQKVSSYLISWPHEGPDTTKHFVLVKEYLGQLSSVQFSSVSNGICS
jgi:hypothetical protein